MRAAYGQQHVPMYLSDFAILCLLLVLLRDLFGFSVRPKDEYLSVFGLQLWPNKKIQLWSFTGTYVLIQFYNFRSCNLWLWTQLFGSCRHVWLLFSGCFRARYATILVVEEIFDNFSIGSICLYCCQKSCCCSGNRRLCLSLANEFGLVFIGRYVLLLIYGVLSARIQCCSQEKSCCCGKEPIMGQKN